MLENSNYVDGQEGKLLNKLCKEYDRVSIEIADLTKTKNNAGTEIKKICNSKGTWESTDYVVTISRIEDSFKLDLKEIENYLNANYPSVLEELKANCMKKSEGYIKLGNIKPKVKPNI